MVQSLDRAFSFGPGLKDRLSANLQRFDARRLDKPDLRAAAVALVVCPGAPDMPDAQACILLTLRPKTIKRHSGQYALPGGRLDAGETTVEAALRELDEELGLRLAPAAVLGLLDDYPTRSGFTVTPVVVWAETDPVLTPAPDEVHKVFRIPIGQLDSPDIPILSAPKEGDQPVLSMILPALGHEMYAPTAAILFQFREVAMRGVATRVAQYDQPGFAWK